MAHHNAFQVKKNILCLGVGDPSPLRQGEIISLLSFPYYYRAWWLIDLDLPRKFAKDTPVRILKTSRQFAPQARVHKLVNFTLDQIRLCHSVFQLEECNFGLQVWWPLSGANCVFGFLSVKPMTATRVIRPRNSYEKLARETPFVCHALSHEFFSRARNLFRVGHSSIPSEKLGVTWLKSSGLIGRQVMFTNKVVFTSVYNIILL